MKSILIFLTVLICSTSVGQLNIDSLIQGNWRIIDSDNTICTRFNSGIVYRKNCDSAITVVGNSYAYSIEANFIEVIPHPLEQIHYKIIEAKGDTLVVNSYRLKLKKRDMRNGSPLKKRRKLIRQEIWVKN